MPLLRRFEHQLAGALRSSAKAEVIMRNSLEFKPFVVRRYLAAMYERIAIPDELVTGRDMIIFASAATGGKWDSRRIKTCNFNAAR
ncbi:MAG TPA: hypothetical protein P5077_12720 [bacterium]|nr:hypothetical protein [bacterium]